MLVSTLISGVRTALHDANSAVYLDPEVLAAYNRAVEEVQAMLLMIGARVALTSDTITGDGINYRYNLQENCLGVEPDTLRGRSPSNGTTDYTHGAPITLVDDAEPIFTMAPTASGVPRTARIDTSGDRLALVFPCILTSGDVYDLKYYPKMTTVSAGTEAATSTPWGGRLDRVLSRAVEVILRAGAEFVGEPRMEWLKAARAEASTLLGLNTHQKRKTAASMFAGGAWSR